jgi:hypothetical protein
MARTSDVEGLSAGALEQNAPFIEANRIYREMYPEAVAALEAKLSAAETLRPCHEPTNPPRSEGEWITVRAPEVVHLDFTTEAWEQVLSEVEAARERVQQEREIVAEMSRLSEAQRARLRRLKVDAASRALLRRMASARLPASSSRPRGALRGGPRRRSVRTGPRRARAPSSQQGEDPEPPPLARPPSRGCA